MSFNFGSTTNPGLGQTSTPAKLSNMAGAGFGSFSFAAQSSAAPVFGTTTTTSSAPPFGAATNFGATGFGATTAAQPSLGGFGGFGTTTTAAAPSIFGGLGTTSAGGFSGFGTTTTTSQAPSFGGFGTGAATTGFGSFAFGKPATSTAPAFGGFGTGFGLQQQTQPFQQQQQQQQLQQQQQQLSSEEAFAQSIFNVSIYGDERDTIIAKWNYLQAMWGNGKSFYSQSAPPVDITPQNYLCRFKSMAYSRLPGKDNKAGLVALIFNKPHNDVKNQQQQIIGGLGQLFGNKPNILINIDSIKQLEDKTQIVIYVEERNPQAPNESKRILATEVSSYLNQPNVKPQLTNLGADQALALVLPDEDQLKEYLETPPKGIDPRMWKQAKIDNPDPTKFIPIPMIGFNELKWRIKCQEYETDTHVHYLAKVEKDLTELKQRHAAASAKIMEHKRKLAELSHKILKIVVKQECTRKVGMALSPEEEVLKSKLENMQAFMSAPTQFKGRLSELLSQMRMQRNQYAMTATNEYTLDKDSEEEMKTFLTMQQKAMELLIDTVNKDTKALQIISEGMKQITRG